jgi:hypothetical protein
MSKWQEHKSAINERALARLTRALPDVFPPAVLGRALGRPFIPPTPRLAIDSYWRAHPLRADRLARALAARSGQPDGWTWQLGKPRNGLPATFRIPPAPYREKPFARGPAFCCVCGQPVYQFGWHACGARARTSVRAGMAPVSLPGNFGMRQASKSPCCDDCRPAAAGKRAAGCGGTRRSITACRFIACGANIAVPRGPTYSDTGACPTCKSSIATRMFSNARTKRATAAGGVCSRS